MAAWDDDRKRPALRCLELMPSGNLEDFREVVAPDGINHEAAIEPSAARTSGPEAFHAAARWLRGAFTDLSWSIEHVVTEGDLVVIEAIERGRHTGPFVLYDADGGIDTVWAPTGRSFAVRQSHWFRVTDGLVTEHWADRDDLGQGQQAGWLPPSPVYLLRCARAKRRAVREQSGR